jgi:serine/threonine protein kinase
MDAEPHGQSIDRETIASATPQPTASLAQDPEEPPLLADQETAIATPHPAASPALDRIGPRPVLEGPGTRMGPYRLLQKLGEGGMGIVYMAEQEAPVRRRVALKIIKPGMDTEQVVARFEVERQALALMDHPNIARVLEAGATDTGRPYFVMELVKGIPVTEYCDGNRLSPRERLELFVPVCQAVQHAHQKGIIHRDIKPSNILVTTSDGQPVPKVIDFGVAKAIDRRLTERTMFTQFGQVIGTLEYMSPEQAELGALDVDTRSDIYSLGAVLFELLTGSTPLHRARTRAAGYAEMLRRIREEETPRPSTRLSDSRETLPSISAQRKMEPARLAKLVRGELDWIVMKALERDRTRRYQTANALARDLQRYLHEEPVEAGPPSATYRLRKLARKHRGLLATTGAFVALLAMAALAGTALAIRAIRAERQALADRNRAVDAEHAARAEADKALAINRFLTEDLLSQAEPSNRAAASGVTLREVLDRAAEKVGERFTDQPATEAAVRRTIAGTYHGLGAFDRGERQWRAVAAIEGRRLGPEDAETWKALGEVGHMLNHQARYDEALELLGQAHAGLRRALGPEHRSTISAATHLALAYEDAGRRAAAVPLFEEILRLREAAVGPDHPDTLGAMNNLAGAYRAVGRIGDALPLSEAALQRLRASLGPDHPSTLDALSTLASTYQAAGRPADALPLMEEAVKLRKDRLGLGHLKTLGSINDLALAYQTAGRLKDAVPLFEQNFELARVHLGADHHGTLVSMTNLGAAYRDTGRLPDAIRLLEEARKKCLAKLGPDHPSTLDAMSDLASTYRAAGRLDEALALFEDTLKLARIKLGPDHPDTLETLNDLAGTYLDARRWADAEATARQCLGICEKKQLDDWRRYLAMSQLGAALSGQKKPGEAESLLIGGYDGLKARAGKIPAAERKSLADAGARIVASYEA